jgi:hypothetical protein
MSVTRPRATFVAGLVLGLLTLGLARTAAAGPSGIGGAIGTTVTTLTADDLLIVVQDASGSAFRDFDLQRFFNISNCQCNAPMKIFFTLSDSGFLKKASIPAGTIQFWIGSACNNITPELRSCRQLGSTQVLTSFANLGGVVVDTDVQTMSQNFGQPSTAVSGVDGGGVVSGTGPSGPDACNTGITFAQSIWALVTLSTNTVYDPAATLQVTIDLAPPPPPTNVIVGSGNEALVVNWTGIDTTTLDDLLGYQVLCDRGGELQVFPTGSFSSGIQTCIDPTVPFPTGLDAHVRGLDPLFACSNLLSTVTSSFRIKILENQVTYGVAVVAVDTRHNASAPMMIYGAPQKTLSFYDTYRNGSSTNNQPGDQSDPGRATGGYCAVAPHGRTISGAELAAVGLVIVAGGLALGTRRRRSRRGRRQKGREEGRDDENRRGPA